MKNQKIKRPYRVLSLVLASFMIVGLLQPMNVESHNSKEIIGFDKLAPQYTEIVEKGTNVDELNLPETLRAIVPLEEDAEVDSFEQAEPVADMSDGYASYDYYWYGYVAPENVEECYENDELAIYTIYYASEDGSGTVGEMGYRLYGSLDSSEDQWFVCSENGEITGVIVDVPVEWDTTTYDGTIEGQYVLEGTCTGYQCKNDTPKVKITVGNQIETVSEEINTFTLSNASANNAEIMMEYMRTATPTDKNLDYKADGSAGTKEPIPGEWKNYVNTIWQNKALNKFEWTTDPEGVLESNGVKWKWSGVKANKSGDPKTDPLAIPHKEADNGKIYVVYSGEQLLYALDVISSSNSTDYASSTVYLGANIDLNGMEFNWRPIEFVNQRIEISGMNGTEDKIIYNLGSFGAPDKKGVGIVDSLSGNLVSQHVIYKTALLVGTDDVNKRTHTSLFGYSDTCANSCRLEDTHVVDSMFFGTQQVSAFGRREYGSSMVRCSTENCYFYGVDHVTSMSTGITPYHYYGTGRYIIEASNNNKTIKVYEYVLDNNGNRVKENGVYKKGDHVTTITVDDTKDILIKKNDIVTGIYRHTSYGQITNSYAAGNLLATTGGHSAGFASCYMKDVNIKECFSSIEMYVTTYSGGFTGLFTGTVEDCFATGKLEGFKYLGGFSCSVENGTISNKDNETGKNDLNDRTVFKNCYTTVLTGMRSESSSMGGFAATDVKFDGEDIQNMSFKDCYAAGEVGNISTNMAEPEDVGGFLNIKLDRDEILGNCYYDKQTTAMREWVTGNSKSLEGVKGVLTTDTSNDKAGTGLTSAPGTVGFTGFSDNSKWDYTAENHYPELTCFKNADATTWGSADAANVAKAYSLASTATVMLGTWNEGYDWDKEGVRTAEEISYAREDSDHKGGKLTYDTVRDIIAPFKVTETATYINKVNNGSGANIAINSTTGNLIAEEQGAIVINNTTHDGITENPGMDWFEIQETVNQKMGYRPIRLVGYMSIEAGNDKTLGSGELYDHRDDVSLTMMDTIKDNMVVGFEKDESQTWSSSLQGGYPDTIKYYAAPTTHLETNHSASKDAWIYTEIWRAKQDNNGNYSDGTVENGYLQNIGGTDIYLQPEISVKVTGKGTESGDTLSQRKWNGLYPIYLDKTTSHKYIVSYYWMLSDGRYVTDYKIVTVEPGTYELNMDVRSYISGQTHDPLNANSLMIAASMDNEENVAYSIPEFTSEHTEITGIPFGKNVSVGWQYLNEDVKIKKAQIDFYAINKETNERQYMGTGYYDSADLLKELSAGKTVQITVDTTFVYDVLEKETTGLQAGLDREVTYTKENQKVVYDVTLKEDNKTLEIRFAKFQNNSKPGEKPLGIKDITGLDGVEDQIYVNDLMYCTDVTLWTERALRFQKLDETGKPFGENDASFKLYKLVCSDSNHDHSEDKAVEASDCWEIFDADKKDIYTDKSGFIVFDYVPVGEYRLVETKTKDGYMLPDGQWKVIVKDEYAGRENGFTITAIGDNPAPAFSPTTTNPGGFDARIPVVHNYPTVKIKKIVEGNMGDWNKEFQFTAKITYNGKQITVPAVENKYTVDSDGILHFDLKHGEMLEIPYSIPVGATIEFAEENGKYTTVYTQEIETTDSEGNATKETVELKSESKGIITKTIATTVEVTEATPLITVTNTLDTTVNTGVNTPIHPITLLLTFTIVAVIGGKIYLEKERRLRRYKH